MKALWNLKSNIQVLNITVNIYHTILPFELNTHILVILYASESSSDFPFHAEWNPESLAWLTRLSPICSDTHVTSSPFCSFCSGHNGLLALPQMGWVFSCPRLLAFAVPFSWYTLALDICKPQSLTTLHFLLKWHWIKGPLIFLPEKKPFATQLCPLFFDLAYFLQSFSTVDTLFTYLFMYLFILSFSLHYNEAPGSFCSLLNPQHLELWLSHSRWYSQRLLNEWRPISKGRRR